MNRVTRKILVTIGAAVTLGATGGAALAATTAPAATALAARTVTTSVPRCLEQNLSAGLHGAEAAGDHVGFILTLTNQGQRSCSVDGYPGLGLQDWNHHAVPSRTSPEPICRKVRRPSGSREAAGRQRRSRTLCSGAAQAADRAPRSRP